MPQLDEAVVAGLINWTVTLNAVSPTVATIGQPFRGVVLRVASPALASLARGWTLAISDRLTISDDTAREIALLVAEMLAIHDKPGVQAQSPYAPAPLELVVVQQARSLIIPLPVDDSMTISITPPEITLYTGDSGPNLTFQIVDDGTGLPINLTGATVDFLIRRNGQRRNVFSSPLTQCTIAPNPAVISSTVTGDAVTPQTINVSSTTGWSALAPNNVIVAGIGTGNQETVTITAVGTGTVTGLFTKSHSAGDLVALTSVQSVSAINGYCSYDWPAGGLVTASTYTGQLRITMPTGAVEHSAQFTIKVGQSL